MPKREIGEIPTAPPALLLMLREFASGGKWEDVRKRIRATVPDLKEQSFGFESQNLSRSEPLNPTRSTFIFMVRSICCLAMYASCLNAESPQQRDLQEVLD
jgi:hypothetical protein